MNNLALIYERQERYAEAQPLYDRAVKRFDRLGASIPTAIAARDKLARLRAKMASPAPAH